MRIGISVSSSHPGADPRVGAQNMVERARAARLAQLDSLFVGDHHVTPSPYYQNTAVLGRMLAEWGAAPFGALYLLPLWHPVILAEQIATLASLAPGRFIMQCGLGDHAQGRALGIDMRQRVPMFEASLGVLQQLWRGERVSEQRFWGLQDAHIAPLPAEPIDTWVGAIVPAAVDRAARLAQGWLAAPSLKPQAAEAAARQYLERCEAHGRPAQAVAIRRDIHIGASAESARADVAAELDKGYRGIAPEALLVGSASEVAAQLERLRQAGYTDVIVRNISSNQSLCLASIERLAEVRACLPTAPS
ncbi:MAG: LLM class flavin-dependent oxidoreductase [Pseudomonadales bacterium]